MVPGGAFHRLNALEEGYIGVWIVASLYMYCRQGVASFSASRLNFRNVNGIANSALSTRVARHAIRDEIIAGMDAHCMISPLVAFFVP